jgi:hypothetical protein
MVHVFEYDLSSVDTGFPVGEYRPLQTAIGRWSSVAYMVGRYPFSTQRKAMTIQFNHPPSSMHQIVSLPALK